MKRIVALALSLVMAFACLSIVSVPAEAAAAPKWSANAVSGITKTDAKISVKATFSSKMKFTQGGFYIGTSKTNMHKNAYPDKCNIQSKTLTSSFQMSKYKETLKPGTTYYYKTYVVANGKTYTSPIYSFKTAAEPQSANTKWTPSVSNITFDDADLTVSAKLPVKAKITKCGFSIGTDKAKLQKNGSPKNLNSTGNSVFVTFNMGKCKQTLKPNTTYYYQYYVVSGGKTYTSGIYSFKTLSQDTYAKISASGVSKTNATLTANISNAKTLGITKMIVQLSTDKNKQTTIASRKILAVDGMQTYQCVMSALGRKLKANTIYYYRLGIVADGKTYYTQTQSFQTESDATKIVFPLPTNKVWYCSTYTGHGGANKSAQCSVDITLKNKGSCKGLPVYAVADGTVISDTYKNSNGQITIKHTVPLTTINGKVYKTWYTTYAHMTNITVKNGTKVKAGQQIGKVGSVGRNSTGPHLHLSIGSGNGGTGWYQEKDSAKSISPYYIYGFVNAAGQDNSYLVRDMKGTAVTKWLINHKPTGK